LVIHLKRFDNFQRKIKKFIKYDSEINYLDKFLFSKNHKLSFDGNDTHEPYKYKLYAVLVHDGFSINSGHYYCYIKNSNDMWYVMNDSFVGRVSEKEVLQQTPYILFYERVLDKKVVIANTVSNNDNQINNFIKKHSDEILSSLDTSTSDNFINIKVSPFESNTVNLKEQLKEEVKKAESTIAKIDKPEHKVETNNKLESNDTLKEVKNVQIESEHTIIYIKPANLGRKQHKVISRRLNKLKIMLKQIKLNRIKSKKTLTTRHINGNTMSSANIMTAVKTNNIETNPATITPIDNLVNIKSTIIKPLEKVYSEDNKINSWKLKELYGTDSIERWEDSETEADSKLKQQISFIKTESTFKQKSVPKKTQHDIEYDTGRLKKVRVKKPMNEFKTNFFQNIQNKYQN
jgi:hypothetical protein